MHTQTEVHESLSKLIVYLEVGPWGIFHEVEQREIWPRVQWVKKLSLWIDSSESLYLFHVFMDAFYFKSHLKFVFLAILMTSQWRNTPWRMRISFSTGTWRTALAIQKHIDFVSPHDIKSISPPWTSSHDTILDTWVIIFFWIYNSIPYVRLAGEAAKGIP